MVVTCRRGLRRSQENTHTPIDVDSRKKAISASMASGAPKTSPTKPEWTDSEIHLLEGVPHRGGRVEIR
jgi:hypothetical protein